MTVVITRKIEVSPAQLADLNYSSRNCQSTSLNIGIRLTNEELPDDLIASEMSRRNLIRVTDFETQKLIDELKDRGFAVVNPADLVEVDETLENAEVVLDLIAGLRAAKKIDDMTLLGNLVDALIYVTEDTDEEDQQQAA